MTKRVETDSITHPNILIVGIHAPYNHIPDIKSYYDEFENLVKSSGIMATETAFIKLRQIDATYFLTKGKVDELAELCHKHKIDQVIFSEPLSVQQERNLNYVLKAQVFDRTTLILDIFEKGAHSAEGKTQVEIARLQHQKSRLAGRGIHMSQQSGKIGVRGPGETAKEKEIQHIERLILKLSRDLDKLEQQRETQRKRRLTSQIQQFCLVGYTNAGKSTILNTLTHSQVLAENRLFATLDTTTRELYIDGQKKGVISDTVGFIQLIPHNLIEAFKSTLKELQYATLLLHIIDISDINWEAHIKVVLDILIEINVDRPMLYVFNKIDKIKDPNLLKEKLDKYQPHVLISAESKDGNSATSRLSERF